MTAQEARQNATEINATRIDGNYSVIKHAIATAVKGGKFFVDVFSYIDKDIQEKLKKEGYSIQDLSDNIRNEPLIRITW